MVYDLIEKVKKGGSVPFLKSEKCSNGWATPSPDIFEVRGCDYFSTKSKIPSADYLLKPLGFDWIKGSSKVCEIMNNPNSRVRKALDNQLSDELSDDEQPFVWVFNLQLPSRDNYSLVAYYVAAADDPKLTAEDRSMMDRFVKGDDGFRNSRLKFIANVANGPWIVRKAVGDQAICLIGQAVSCNYVISNHFIEVDIDVGASMVANAIVHLALGYVTRLTFDMAFLIESQTEPELPERILGGLRFSDLSLASAAIYVADDSGNLVTPSFSQRLRRSFGLSNGNSTTAHGPCE